MIATVLVIVTTFTPLDGPARSNSHYIQMSSAVDCLHMLDGLDTHPTGQETVTGTCEVTKK